MFFSPSTLPPSITPSMLLLSARPPHLFTIPTDTATTIKPITSSTLWKPSPFHFITSQQKLLSTIPHFPLAGGGGDDGGYNNWFEQWPGDDHGDNHTNNSHGKWVLFCLLLSSLSFSFLFQFTSRALAIEKEEEEEEEVVWEVKGGKRTKLVPDHFRDVFVLPSETWGWSKSAMWFGNEMPNLWVKCREVFRRLMLPEGFPESVTSDYLEFSLWRSVQEVAAQVSGVLATQSLLYAVGLGKGAIPAAAAVNWVLKDGIGYLSKILLSNFGRHFDVNPKGWRLFADFMEDASFGMEILTPAFPHLFVPIAAAAGAGRSAASLIQAATGSCFYAGFAAQRNFAEVIAKAEAQGMVSKSVGIMLGIALANCVQTSTPLTLASFGIVTCVHMLCNMKSYQSVQLRTLNPYRASLVFGEYLLSGLIPSVKEVNDEEPFFPALPLLCLKPASQSEPLVLSAEAKAAAAVIEQHLQLGAKLSDVVKTKTDTLALQHLYRHQGYILTKHHGSFCVILKESCSPQDMLKSMFHVNYLYWLEKNAGLKSINVLVDCRSRGVLRISLEYVEREFNHVKRDGELVGWATDTLVARPLPHRICYPGNV